MSESIPAQISHPGKLIQKELDARGWPLGYLAACIGMPEPELDGIVEGDTDGITPEMAVCLGRVFGTSSRLWARLDANYRIWKERQGDEQMQDV